MRIMGWMRVMGLAVMGLAGLAAAGPARTPAGGGAFYVETFFDEYQKADAVQSFTYTENGVLVTLTANAGMLLRENGVICPSEPAAGISVTLSEVVDQFAFYGPGVPGEEGFLVAHAAYKGGTWLQIVPAGYFFHGPATYGSFGKINSISGFTVTQSCLDMVRFDEFDR